jgi:hypothetical protein
MKSPAARSLIARGLVRTILALVVAGVTAAAGAQATYGGTLYSGLWWVQGEGGSGMTATHEEPYIFLTFYLYRSDRSSYWLTATVVRQPDVNGSLNYTGDLYETSGPPFGGPFDPTTVTHRKVGPISMLARDGYTVTLTYTIDGVFISKAYTRFTVNQLDFSGTYAGWIIYATTNCSSPALNGRAFAQDGVTTVTQSTGSLTIVVNGANTTCTLSGDYSQRGPAGNSSGNFTCTDGNSGPMALGGMTMTSAGFTAEFLVNAPQCYFSGTLSGLLISRPRAQPASGRRRTVTRRDGAASDFSRREPSVASDRQSYLRYFARNASIRRAKSI